MKQSTRREALKMCAMLPLDARFTPDALALASQGSDTTAAAAGDLSEAVITATMHRTPNPADLGKWGYAIALYLYGQYLVYKRIGDKKHLDYIQGWVDSHVNEAGEIDQKITALDYMLPGNLLIVLHKETGQKKYKTAAESIRHTFDNYPRTKDRGFGHADSRKHQLWLDGMYMSMPFLVRDGQQNLVDDQPDAGQERADEVRRVQLRCTISLI